MHKPESAANPALVRPAREDLTPPQPACDRPRAGLAAQGTDLAWSRDPSMIRRFIEQRPHYEQLCDEVAYTLSELLKNAGITVAAISFRVKTLESFLEKVQRKPFRDPFAEITDFAGARVVCFYPDDILRIEDVIRLEFEVREKEDKRCAADVDRFGYSATHFLVSLGAKTNGPRYDSLKGRLCEIQVRTVLQDAWAVFSHHLMYKHEDEIPDVLKREIHGLAGALSTADTAFQAIREKRDQYIASVAASGRSKTLGDVETNLDSIRALLEQRFAGRPVEAIHGHLGIVLSRCQMLQDYPRLQDIAELLNRTATARDRLFELLPRPFLIPGDRPPSATELFWACQLAHPGPVETYPLPTQSAFQRALLEMPGNT